MSIESRKKTILHFYPPKLSLFQFSSQTCRAKLLVHCCDALYNKNVFGSVVAGVFQITFYAKMHANDVFSFF